MRRSKVERRKGCWAGGGKAVGWRMGRGRGRYVVFWGEKWRGDPAGVLTACCCQCGDQAHPMENASMAGQVHSGPFRSIHVVRAAWWSLHPRLFTLFPSLVERGGQRATLTPCLCIKRVVSGVNHFTSTFGVKLPSTSWWLFETPECKLALKCCEMWAQIHFRSTISSYC